MKTFQIFFEATTPTFYDFGGGEYPCDEENLSITVVDQIPQKTFRASGFKQPYIQANLNNFVQLTPVREASSGQTAKYIKNLPNFAKTINGALAPGGKITFYEGYANGWKSTYDLCKLLAQQYNFKVVQDENSFSSPEVEAYLKSIGVSDPKLITSVQAKKFDNSEWADHGSIQISLKK